MTTITTNIISCPVMWFGLSFGFFGATAQPSQTLFGNCAIKVSRCGLEFLKDSSIFDIVLVALVITVGQSGKLKTFHSKRHSPGEYHFQNHQFSNLFRGCAHSGQSLMKCAY